MVKRNRSELCRAVLHMNRRWIGRLPYYHRQYDGRDYRSPVTIPSAESPDCAGVGFYTRDTWGDSDCLRCSVHRQFPRFPRLSCRSRRQTLRLRDRRWRWRGAAVQGLRFSLETSRVRVHRIRWGQGRRERRAYWAHEI